MKLRNLNRLLICAEIATLLCGVFIKAYAAQHSGRVTVNGVPLPGATVIATRGGETIAVVTSLQGIYQFLDIAPGEWHLAVEMQGFRTVDTTVTIPESRSTPPLEMQMLPLTEVLAIAKATLPSAPAPVVATTVDRFAAKPKAKNDASAPTLPEAASSTAIMCSITRSTAVG